MTLFGWAGLAGTTFAAALLQAVSGFGFAVLAVPLYLLLAGTAAQTVRATLLAFFALSYGATVASHVATVGIPGSTWAAAGVLAPFAVLGGLAGRPVGDRLGSDGFAIFGERFAHRRRALHRGRRGCRSSRSPTMKIPGRPTEIVKSPCKSSDAIAKNEYDPWSYAGLQSTVSLVLRDNTAAAREQRQRRLGSRG